MLRLVMRCAQHTSAAGSEDAPHALSKSMNPALDLEGFCVARKAVPDEQCHALREHVLSEAAVRHSSWPLWLASLLGRARTIREPRLREHVPLTISPEVSSALHLALRGLGGEQLSRAGVSQAAQLVELSAMLSLPGAAAQRPHTDVPPATRQRMVTHWIALQPVGIANVPTVVLPTDPSAVTERIDWALLKQIARRQTSRVEFG